MVETEWFRTLQRYRYPLSAVFDSALWFIALTVAVLARLGFDPSTFGWRGLVVVALFLGLLQVVIGVSCGLYRGRRPVGSFAEVRLVSFTAGVTTAAGLSLVLIAGPPNLVPLSTILSAGAYQLLGSLGLRYSLRWLVERASRSDHIRPRRLIVFGAGEAGEQIIKALNRDPYTDLDPVALLDDDPTRRRLILDGVRVVGNRRDIARAARDYVAETLLLAMPSVSREQIDAIAELGRQVGLTVKILPSVHTLARAHVTVGDIEDVQMVDLLIREENQIDDESVRDYVRGKVVLVTGAGGSVGSVLSRTLARYEPSRLIMVDRDENALHLLTLPYRGGDGLDPDGLVLCDIRDVDALRSVFASTLPEVVFHAAAHKHVTFLERFPEEGFKTNVLGTLNVLTASGEGDVSRFVNISTDKAADPINVLGRTKRLAEELASFFDANHAGTYTSVRFGNVLGSKGSVIPTFVHQLQNGYKLTVTDPDVTRYFMTTEEAVLLVLQAGALGKGGDVLVLDMGEPVSVDDLARRVARQVTPTDLPDINYVGLRPGEKLHEVLSASDDEFSDQPHQQLTRYWVPPVDPGLVTALSSAETQAATSGTWLGDNR